MHLTNNGSDWADITVSKVSFPTSYKGTYYTDTPDKGNVYMQVWVTYKAVVDGVDYNQFDWDVFVDGSALQNTFTVVLSGPSPTLSSGWWPAGRTASGWLIYEVPVKGQVVLSYKGNMFSNQGPIFEYQLRAK